MSMFGDIAVEVELRQLLEYLDSLKAYSPEVQLALLRKRIEEDQKAAQGGWL